MTLRWLMMCPWLLACGDAASSPEVDAVAEVDALDATDSRNDIDGAGDSEDALEVDVTPIGPPPALTIGPSFVMAGATSLGTPLVVADATHAWFVPMLADTDPVVAERGTLRVELATSGERGRLFLVSVTHDGSPTSAIPVATGVGIVDVLVRCNGALWLPYFAEDGVHVTRIALAQTDGQWSLGEQVTVDLVSDKTTPGRVTLIDEALSCLDDRPVLAIELEGAITLAHAGIAAGTMIVGTGARAYIDLNSILEGRPVASAETTPWSSRGSGSDGTLLFSRGQDGEALTHTLHRHDFATDSTTSVIDHHFSGQPTLLVESADTVVVCGQGREPELGAADETVGLYCVGLRDGAVAWFVDLPFDQQGAGASIDDTVWVAGAAQQYTGGTYTGTVGKLIGLDARTGSRVAFAEHRVAGFTLPFGAPRRMNGEGRCAGTGTIGIGLVALEDDPAKLAMDTVIAGPTGTVCAEQIGYFEGVSFTAEAPYRPRFGWPAAGACATRPHLVALNPRPSSRVGPLAGPVDSPLLLTTRASDCAIAVESLDAP